MIDIAVVVRAAKLKKEMDAAYLVFKKNPTPSNALLWSTATRQYNEYCVKVMTSLIEQYVTTSPDTEDIMENFEKYSTCKTCNAELLFPTLDDHYVASSDFIEAFPGWCYSCLLEHCTTHECDSCTVAKYPEHCSFKEVKDLHVQQNS